MRTKLLAFTQFANTLLPHETSYLLSVQHFQDTERLDILKQVDFNCKNIDQFTPYGGQINKRKYSHVKTWIEERLNRIDVDRHFTWMSEVEQHIVTDTILPEQEKKLLKEIRRYKQPGFFFIKFYELTRAYHHFLLVRMRYDDEKMVGRFLETFAERYQYSLAVSEKIHAATKDIVGQYRQNNQESEHWKQWLTEVFYDENLDGHNRYQALVRLSFIGFNYRQYDSLLEHFEYIDQLFARGINYSKRLLANYYHNRLILHSNFKQLDHAAYYGKLSIRAKNHDYLHYVNNLVAILLRKNEPQRALLTIREASKEAKVTQNLHSKISYVAFYIECLNKNAQYKSAENYASTFLKAYKKEVLQYRWHLFFSAYLEALLQQGKYRKMLRVIWQNQLIEKDKKYQSRANYLPTISWYRAVAAYKEGIWKERDVEADLLAFADPRSQAAERTAYAALWQQLERHIPELLSKVSAQLTVASGY